MEQYREYNNLGKIYNEDAFEFLDSLKNINLQIHDIPYYIEPFTNTIDNTANGTGIVRDFNNWDMVNIDIPKFCEKVSKAASDNSNVLIFYNNWYYISDLIKELSKYFDTVDTLVWYKTNPKPQIRKRQFVLNHELIIWARRGKYTLNFTNHRDMYSIKMNSLAMGNDRIKYINEQGKRVSAHPTQKPCKLIEYYIDKLSNEGDIVVDAYAGVLTTAVAALRTNRRFIVNDKNLNYIKFGEEWINKELLRCKI